MGKYSFTRKKLNLNYIFKTQVSALLTCYAFTLSCPPTQARTTSCPSVEWALARGFTLKPSTVLAHKAFKVLRETQRALILLICPFPNLDPGPLPLHWHHFQPQMDLDSNLRSAPFQPCGLSRLWCLRPYDVNCGCCEDYTCELSSSYPLTAVLLSSEPNTMIGNQL